MMRATKEQLSRLRENVGLKTKRAAAKKPRTKKRHDELPENQIEGQIIGFLRANGFRCIKQHVGVFRKGNSFFRFGTPGDPDWLCMRPLSLPEMRHKPECTVMWIEVKAPGKKPSAVQMQRLIELRRLGFVAEWFDSYEKFREWL